MANAFIKGTPRDSSVRYAASLTFYASFNDATKPPWFLSICFKNMMGRLSTFKAELKLSRLQLTFTVPCNPDNRSQPSVAPNTIIETSYCVFHSYFRCWKVLRAHAQILKKQRTIGAFIRVSWCRIWPLNTVFNTEFG